MARHESPRTIPASAASDSAHGPAESKRCVFISHATDDKWIARQICSLIEDECHAETFRDDRDIDGGDDIPDTIRDAINACHEFIVLLTPESIARDWVKIELGAAWAMKKRIVIVLHHIDTDPLPDTFKPRKALQLNDVDQYFEELRKRMTGAES